MTYRDLLLRVIAIAIIILVLPVSLVKGQVRYRDLVFSAATATNGIKYGEATNISGTTTSLLMDVYEPTGDTQNNRPLIIWIHGGSLISGDKSELTNYCSYFARLGYVTATINYRLGIQSPKGWVTILEAWLRAVQDGKAAVRYFRSKAAQYRIDTNQIYVSGSSAGSMIAVHMAYWDQSEIPINLDQTKWGNLEGTGGNPGYSSAIQGVLNYCGAIADTTWIQAGEPPVGCFHGLLDNIVPPNNGVSLDFGIRLFGGVAINRIADRLGIFTKGAFFPTMGHGTGGDPTFGDSLLSFTVDFFYSLVKQNTAVEIEASALPSSFHLMNNYPNPFNPATIIGYHIPNKTTVRLCVMDVAGRTVATLVDCTNEAGYHEVVWDAECMPSGTYFYRIIAGSFIETKSMILLK